MGFIVIGGLLIKRMRERPRRKWKIWLADVGKQVVGQFIVHLSNVAISGKFQPFEQHLLEHSPTKASDRSHRK